CTHPGSATERLTGEFHRQHLRRPTQQAYREHGRATGRVDVRERVPRGDPAPVVGLVAGRDLARATTTARVLHQPITHDLILPKDPFAPRGVSCEDVRMDQGGVSGLVTGAVFKTVEGQALPLAGSIPVHLRYHNRTRPRLSTRADL